MSSGDAHTELRLDGRGAFDDPPTELAYRDWNRERSAAFERSHAITTLVSLAAGVSAVAGLGLLDLRMVLCATVVGASSGLRPLTTTVPRLRAWYEPSLAAGNAIWGLAVVYVCAVLLGQIELSVVAVTTCAMAGFFEIRTRPSYALAAVLVYIVPAVILVAVAMASGAVGRVFGVCGLVSFAAVVWTGARMARGLDAERRHVFGQERIIEAQRATIARQQALLEKELSHQVAERSRELGAVLARSDLVLDVRALKAGERFAERYRVIAALGAGGMGAVYEVERVTDGQRLALKAVVGEVSGASAARFAREAEIGARIRHPNLISIVDVGVSSGVPFLVMDLVRGGSLESQRANFGDVAWALPILRQIAEGLAALHDAGVVHRDLKPANVLLDGTTAKISDFGISRFGSIDEATADPNAATMAATPKKSAELTGTGVVMGTPLYMAPEGARSARALDASADVFAFGILAYEMLTGRSPFPVPAFVLAMAGQPIPTPAAIDDAWLPDAARTCIVRALDGDPTRRPRVRAIGSALA